MKSIKEKSEEYSLEPRANAHCGYDEEDLGNSFEAGAYYVLEQIEQLIYEKHFEGLPLFNLTHLIDKLKEE